MRNDRWWSIETQIAALRDSPHLRLYGAALTATHVLTYIFWRGLVPFTFSDRFAAYCWPGTGPFCHWFHGGPEIFWKSVWVLYLLAALATVVVFIVRGRERAAWFSLAGLTLFKLLVYAADYRLVGNYHLMPFVASLAFLFFPAKSQSTRLLICLFYFFAGTLKLNAEWLSGAALDPPRGELERGLFSLSLAYVVVLETLFSWGLIHSRAWVRWSTLAQFAIFHALSFQWVGWFYPTIMACLLAIFPLEWLRGRKAETTMFPLPKPAAVFVAAFVAAQIFPRLALGDRFALESRTRSVSLHMFDARTLCLGTVLAKFRNETLDLNPDYGRSGGRIRCDPVLFFWEAQSLCRENADRPDFLNASAHLVSIETTGLRPYRILRFDNLCGPRASSAAESP